jgi:hypothetical protein
MAIAHRADRLKDSSSFFVAILQRVHLNIRRGQSLWSSNLSSDDGGRSEREDDILYLLAWLERDFRASPIHFPLSVFGSHVPTMRGGKRVLACGDVFEGKAPAFVSHSDQYVAAGAQFHGGSRKRIAAIEPLNDSFYECSTRWALRSE